MTTTQPVALVTGATSGIGKAAALALADGGFEVIGTGRNTAGIAPRDGMTYLDLDVSFIRLGWVVLSIVPGFIIGGLIAYIAAWLLVPEGRVTATTSPTKRLVRSSSDRVVAGVCGGLAEYLHVDPTLVRLVVVILAVYPGAVIFGVLVYVAAWLIIPSGSAPLHPVSSTA